MSTDPCTMNGWPKQQIQKRVCKHCRDTSCYKYDSVDRTIKTKTKKEDIRPLDQGQQILEGS